MEWNRRKKIFWRVPMVAIITTALFWTAWYAIAGSVPEGIFGISRWLDIPLVGIFALIMAAMVTLLKFFDNNLSTGLNIGLIYGLLAGLFLGLCFGTSNGLFGGLLFGTIIGLAAGLFALLVYGLFTICHLLSTKKFWSIIWRSIIRGLKTFGRWVIAE